MDARLGWHGVRPRPQDWRPGVVGSLALALTILLAAIGCRGPSHVTREAKPSGWRGNLWGPEAEAARRRGHLPPVPACPRTVAWEAWARRHLRTGDILLRRGRDARGPTWISRVAAAMADSPYAHAALFAWEDSQPVVYDAITGGLRRQPFGVWMHDVLGAFGVKRPRPEYRACIPAAVAFCRAAYLAQVPFDPRLSLDDERLYCVELVEKAYRSAGLPLSQPVRVEDLPRYGEFPVAALILRLFSPVEPDQCIFAPGNESYGLWSSPATMVVYQADDAHLPRGMPPPQTPARP